MSVDHATANRRTTAPPNRAASPARAEGPDRARRLDAVPANHTFEPTAFGETSEATLAIPVNRGLEAAVVELRVEGTGFRLDSMWAMKLAPAGQQRAGATPDAPRIVFAPNAPGVHRGQLVMTSRWPDGHVERHVIELVGSNATPDASVLGAKPTPAVRLTSLQPRDLGEQIVGSRHTFAVTPPMNIAYSPAFAAVALEGDAELSASWGMPGQVVDLAPDVAAKPITLAYAPRARGTHQGRLQLVAHWPDRHVEHQSVAITAQARELADVPERERASDVASAAPASNPPVDRDKPVTRANYFDMQALHTALEAIAEYRLEGVHVVQKEQAEYKTPSVARPLWLDLAELAIALGTAGMAHLLTSALTKHLQKSLGLGDKPASTASSTNATGSDSSGVAGKVVKGVVDRIESAATVDAKHLVEPSTEANDSRYTRRNSADPEIDFFSSQSKMLFDAKAAANNASEAICSPLLGLDAIRPGASAIGFAALTQNLFGIREDVMDRQKTHTAAQWLAYRTRASLGVERVPVGGGERLAAKMADAREPAGSKLASPSNAKGLLDVFVDIGSGDTRVTGARVLGVSWLVADRMLGVDLRIERVPLRIVLGDGSGYITRDELGRVRYSGLIHLDADSDRTNALDERQQLRTAELIVDQVLDRSLLEWGVRAIDTDDASERPQASGGTR